MRVIDNLRRSLITSPRELVVAYQHPLFHQLLVDSGLFSVEKHSAPRAPSEFGWTLYRHPLKGRE